MFRLPLSVCADSIGAQLKGDDLELTSVSIDTRTLKPGDVYVAIRGDRFDGHRFIDDAIAKGAAAIVADNQFDVSAAGIVTGAADTPVLQVGDTRDALGGIASLWAAGHQVPTIAITGSNGKTSVKEMIASILSQVGSTLSTRGNLNNDIGLPLTLLSITSEHQYVVVEMGANHVGEIKTLSDMTQPDVALITSIGCAHLEGFGSVKAIAAAKSEIFSGVCPGGFGVINLDDRFAPVMLEAADGLATRTFGFSEEADVRGVEPELGGLAGFGRTNLTIKTLDQSWVTPFSLLGRHNLMNALAATAAVQCLDIQRESIIAGLNAIQPVSGRLQQIIGIESSTIIDDSYNANPTSAKAAIDVLASFSGKRHFVLGDMAELGSEAEQMHREVGEYASACGIDQVWTTGTLAKHTADACPVGKHFPSQAELLMAIESELDGSSTVLVKGSRSSHMGVIVRALSEPLTRDTSTVSIDLAEGLPS